MDVYLESDIVLDLMVSSFNTTLYSASAATMPSGGAQMKRFVKEKVFDLLTLLGAREERIQDF